MFGPDRPQMNNQFGESFAAGDRVHWDDTQKQHTGTVKRVNPDDGTALVIEGPYGAHWVDIDSLYRAESEALMSVTGTGGTR